MFELNQAFKNRPSQFRVFRCQSRSGLVLLVPCLEAGITQRSDDVVNRRTMDLLPTFNVGHQNIITLSVDSTQVRIVRQQNRHTLLSHRPISYSLSDRSAEILLSTYQEPDRTRITDFGVLQVLQECRGFASVELARVCTEIHKF